MLAHASDAIVFKRARLRYLCWRLTRSPMREIRGLMCRFAVNSTPRRSSPAAIARHLGAPRRDWVREVNSPLLTSWPACPNAARNSSKSGRSCPLTYLEHSDLVTRGPAALHVNHELRSRPWRGPRHRRSVFVSGPRGEGRDLDKHNMSTSTEPACVSAVRRGL